MKRIIALVLSLVMVICFAACSAGPAPGSQTQGETGAAVADLDYIKSKGKMVIGITEYEPMNFKDSAGNWTGFDTEFAQAVCAKLGVQAEFVEIDWDNKFISLDSKAIDCIWNGMTISDEVLNNTSCSEAYVKNAQVVVMPKDKVASYPDAASMSELSFAVEAGSAGATAAADNNLTNCIEVGAQTDALLEVQSGSSDACIIDITMAKAMVESENSSYGDLAIAIELTSEEYGIGFRKGSDLTAEVNKIKNEMIADGSLVALAEKYNLTLAE